MPPTETQLSSSSFSRTWGRFLDELEAVALLQIQRKRKDPTLAALLRDTLAALREESAIAAIEEAVESASADAPKAIELLERELVYITEKSLAQVRTDAAKGGVTMGAVTMGIPVIQPDAAGAIAQGDAALKDAKIGKDSVEDLLGRLPWVVKKTLKILNEILSLISGAG
ncbi:MAG TPA: hypothetical protein VG838_03790 [Opitutaceae bacterium]|nr:hypothetical protein [Opitutaceae bacterium]